MARRFLRKAGCARRADKLTAGRWQKREERSNCMEDQYEPLIVAFCCNWCSYAGADLAGVSRIQYPPNGRIIRVMCSGMVHPNLVMNALTKGADGVLVCG
jgi:F420-non-reducing hydrogenase iron-sulfur subunit